MDSKLEKWIRCLYEEDSLAQEEEHRRLRVKILILENKNIDLRRNLALGNNRIEHTQNECRDLRKQLVEVGDGVTGHKAALKNKDKEIQSLKSQLTSLDGITADTSNLVAEKLALSRELANIKPEVHHLQAQVSQHQNILAEKLELERQIGVLKIELESERESTRQVFKSVVRTLTDYQSQLETLRRELGKEKREKVAFQIEMESNHQLEVENLKKELAHERQQREKLTKESEIEAQNQLDELRHGFLREKESMEKSLEEVSRNLKLSETRRSVLEKKVDELWENLVASKDQLKFCELELGQARECVVTSNSAPAREVTLAKNARVHDNQDKSNNVTVSPPVGGATRGTRTYKKRGEFEQASVGEKSLFSITPFLNRTANIETDLLSIDADFSEGLEAKNTVSDAEHDPPPVVSSKTRGRKRATKKNPKATQPNISEKPGEIQTELRRAISPPENLIKLIAAEIDKDDYSEDLLNSNQADSTLNSDRITSVGAQSEILETAKEKHPKKKRKLVRAPKVASVGDDEIAPELSTKPGLRSTRLLGEGLFSNLPESSGESAPSFSPLKRDRRSAGKKSS
ncbi:hypothetical protein K3495_g404 [Podosphaera aphanis]|nr:hypothetical protein K3495_g404 [Podosphaera aphanis]